MTRAGRAKSALVRMGVRRRPLRALLNAAYVRLPDERRRHFHHRYCKLFPDADGGLAPGAWRVRFAGRDVLAPLRPEHAWLDWELALSFTGHEQPIKRAYERMLRGPERPDLFVDVGANHGTHSILFLRHGVDALSFEPNPACHDYFRALCRRNGVRGELQPVALGDADRTVTIRYPERQTWLGSLNGHGAGDRGSTRSAEVEQTRLDAYLERLRGRRVLLKIDAEGSELAILRGASTVLRERAPAIVFESWRESQDRGELFDLLADHGYAVAELNASDAALPRETFLRSVANDFLARRR